MQRGAVDVVLLGGFMFTRSFTLTALAISPFALGSFMGCTTEAPATIGPPDGGGVSLSDAAIVDAGPGAEVSTDAGDSQGEASQDANEVSTDASVGAVDSQPGEASQDANGEAESAAAALSGPDSSDSGTVGDELPPGCVASTLDAGTQASNVPPVGTQLVSGNTLSARGVTSDGYEVYSDDAARQLYAIPIAGGAVQFIASLGTQFWVTVVGQVVFAWSNVSDADVGALTIWSSARGAHAISAASFGILGAASSDGTQILYVANVDPQGLTGDVYLATTDGASSTQLLAGQQLTGCFPQLGFAGSYVVVSHCDVPRGSGPSSTITSFRSPAWTRADLLGDAANTWSADTAATMVLVSSANGLLVVPIGGGPGTTIDPEGFMGQLIAGGQSAVYSTTSGSLRLSSTTAPSPRTLAPTFGGFYAISPGESTVLYYQNSSAAGTDMYLASTITPGTSATISSVTNGAVNGDAFTADSTFALYSTSNGPCGASGTFNAFSVAQSASTLLGRNVWSDSSATGAKVLFNDNYVATGGLRFGRADIESVDLMTGLAPTRLVSQADAVFDMTPARDAIVYSWSLASGSLAGLYVVSVP